MLRKLSLGLLVAIALMTGFVSATVAQRTQTLATLEPFLVDIQQTVPFSLTLTLPDTGESVTVPSELDVALSIQIRADGSISPTVKVAEAEEPTVTVEPLAPVSNASTVNSLAWTVVSAENTGQSVDLGDHTYTTEGQFIHLSLRVENMGKTPAEQPLRFVDVLLVDSMGRMFGPMNYDYYLREACDYIDVNPGLAVTCAITFDVPQDATDLALLVSNEDESVVLPLFD